MRPPPGGPPPPAWRLPPILKGTPSGRRSALALTTVALPKFVQTPHPALAAPKPAAMAAALQCRPVGLPRAAPRAQRTCSSRIVRMMAAPPTSTTGQRPSKLLNWLEVRKGVVAAPERRVRGVARPCRNSCPGPPAAGGTGTPAPPHPIPCPRSCDCHLLAQVAGSSSLLQVLGPGPPLLLPPSRRAAAERACHSWNA